MSTAEKPESGAGVEDIRTHGRIPFNRPHLVGTEFERMWEAVEGRVISEGGR